MSTIKELVKKHFNLVEATSLSFGEIKTLDGEITLTYDGEELGEGLEVFVVTADGNVAAPDGDHALESGVTISVADGRITAITESEVEEIEAEEEEIVVETAMEEVTVEAPEGVAEVVEAVQEAVSEEVVAAVTEAVADVVGEMMKKMEDRMTSLEGKFSTFASAPATDKTIAGKNSTSKFKNDKSKAPNAALTEKFIKLKQSLKG
tara:strand:- start:5412 stop:6029 length:618 start_codon:yes stop_codon:yes gene_type:complete